MIPRHILDRIEVNLTILREMDEDWRRCDGGGEDFIRHWRAAAKALDAIAESVRFAGYAIAQPPGWNSGKYREEARER